MDSKIEELYQYLKVWDPYLKISFDLGRRNPTFTSENILLRLRITTCIEIENIVNYSNEKEIGRNIILTLIYFSKKYNLKFIRANTVLDESIDFWKKMNFRNEFGDTWVLDVSSISLLDSFTKKFNSKKGILERIFKL